MLRLKAHLPGGAMTASGASGHQILDRPACTPSAIRAVLAANAGAPVIRRYGAELDAAYEQARQDGDLTPLVQTVRRWWFEADAWRDQEAQRQLLARIERCQRGRPSARRRAHQLGRASRPARALTRHRWDFDGLARFCPSVLARIWHGPPSDACRNEMPDGAGSPGYLEVKLLEVDVCGVLVAAAWVCEELPKLLMAVRATTDGREL